jgi:uncharacterized protein (DUF305 family)
MPSTFRKTLRRFVIANVLVASLLGAHAVAQTPAEAGCDQAGTPMAAMDHGSMAQGEATPGMDMEQVEFDQLYIDMMLPHHDSIIALAEVALPLLEDPRLQDIAQAIIDTQSAEQEELQQLRAEWYGSAEPAAMDDAMMTMMMEMMPGMGSAEEQMQIMDAAWQVQTFCAADNYDLAFIDQAIPHHQMAIDASEIALEQAVHPEIAAIAQEVIDAQQAEIDLLEQVRAELTAGATPST